MARPLVHMCRLQWALPLPAQGRLCAHAWSALHPDRLQDWGRAVRALASSSCCQGARCLRKAVKLPGQTCACMQGLTEAAGSAVRVSFTPHLMPIARGMQSTIYVRLSQGATAADLRSHLQVLLLLLLLLLRSPHAPDLCIVAHGPVFLWTHGLSGAV